MMIELSIVQRENTINIYKKRNHTKSEAPKAKHYSGPKVTGDRHRNKPETRGEVGKPAKFSVCLSPDDLRAKSLSQQGLTCLK